MERDLWPKLHGATVHFPIALVLFSFALEGAGRLFPKLAARRGLHAAGYWSMLLGAAGTVPAVVSGLFMTRGILLGHDALRNHHLFAWPAFALVIGIATWRLLGGGSANERPALGYVAAVGLAAVLVSAAGYWGGEMLVGH
jgi:uncharacterized membrane protein